MKPCSNFFCFGSGDNFIYVDVMKISSIEVSTVKKWWKQKSYLKIYCDGIQLSYPISNMDSCKTDIKNIFELQRFISSKYTEVFETQKNCLDKINKTLDEHNDDDKPWEKQ